MNDPKINVKDSRRRAQDAGHKLHCILSLGSCVLSLVFFMLLCSVVGHAWGNFAIVQSNRPSCSVIVPENLSIQEKFAVEELNYFVEKFTGVRLEERQDSEPLPVGNAILIGTSDDNRYIGELYDRGLAISWEKDSTEDEFIVKVVRDRGRDFLMIVAGQSRGVIYGVYDLVEKMIESIAQLNLVDLDFHVNPIPSLVVGTPNVGPCKPFYPVRCALSREDPTWMSRHRINVSGAEGVWSGTGIDDGLGTAFKYVYGNQFDDMQDESSSERLARVTDLRTRLTELKRRGIDSYLFMYVMGEPTKAMMRNHPELLEAPVQYPHSRNGNWYQPISWTKPEARDMIRELVKSIVRTYSPWLTGFHLRSWGGETRAPAGNDEEQQKLLWEIYFDIIDAAREVDPDFRFLISGYDQYWLRDPDRVYAARLPQGTLLMHKWGLDGEPTNDPGIEVEFINSIGACGQHVLVLSPLWMLEADMFVEGVRKYADNPDVDGLGGFTLQGEHGLAHLDKLVSARIGWNPYEDYVALMYNYLASYYGASATQHILAALRINSLTMADYFSDYAGSLSLTGKYGDGSRGHATRFWNIVGPEAVKDTLSIPDIETAEYAKERLASLLPRQQEAANEIAVARKLVRPVSNQADWDYFDGLHLMKTWVRFFESRLRLVEARGIGLQGGSREQVTQKLSSAIEYSREIQMEISEIRRFTRIFDYDDRSARESLIAAIDEEIDFLRDFDPSEIIIAPEQDKKAEEAGLSITELMNHPNPMNNRTTFCYNLTSDADEVIITIYTIRGRQVRTIIGASPRAGYNEEIWAAEDDDGRKLASGTYFYRMVAERDDERVQKIGRLSIIR
jgi:hypothetical protein